MTVSSGSEVILAAVDDIFFSSRIESVAKGLGLSVVVAPNIARVEEELARGVPRLILLDLEGRACAPIDTLRRIKSDPQLQQIPVVGFFSHVHTELELSAREAGCDRILPRSAFTANLAQILESRPDSVTS